MYYLLKFELEKDNSSLKSLVLFKALLEYD